MAEPLPINLPIFSAAELAHAAGVKRAAVDLWAHRGLISPSRKEQVSSRQRPLYSLAAVFKVYIIRIGGEAIGLSVSEASALAEQITQQDGGRWIGRVALHAERDKNTDWYFALQRSQVLAGL